MRFGGCLGLALLAWANLAACSPTSPVAAETASQRTGSGAASPCLDGQNDTPRQASAACSDAQRAQFLNERGQLYCQSGQYDLAIADQTEAIRLEPDFAEAYADRAGCYVGKGDLKTALSDYDETIRLAPDKAGYYQSRSLLRIWAGDPNGALADYSQALKLAPETPGLLDQHARLLFGLGRFHEAALEFIESARRFPTNPYPVLWLHMARARAHEADDAEFQKGVKRLDLSGWPGPVFDMFLGKITPETMREAYSSSPYGAADGNCEAVFFSGEDFLLRNEPQRARDLFAEGTGACQWQVTQERDDFRFLDDWAELIRLDPKARGAGPLW